MFRSQLNNKIGNLLNYLGSKIPQLGMTKALKLLYLIDETSYMRCGAPVTWLDYKVWQMGPVAEELYNELRYNQTMLYNEQEISLENFIQTQKKEINGNETIVILPNGNFSFEDFSEFEIELIENVTDRFGTYSATQLIDLLHEKETLWHKCVTQNKLDVNFKVYGKKSNHTIDFSELISNNPVLQMAAQSAYENLQFQEDLSNL